jgi:hypothetical protein
VVHSLDRVIENASLLGGQNTPYALQSPIPPASPLYSLDSHPSSTSMPTDIFDIMCGGIVVHSLDRAVFSSLYRCGVPPRPKSVSGVAHSRTAW